MKTDICNILDPFHKEDLQNTLHPSIYTEHTNYNILILRFPTQNEDNKIILVSQGIVFLKDDIFIYEPENDSFIPFEFNWKSLYKFLDKNINNAMDIINDLHEQVIDMEELLYSEEPNKAFLENWFKIKKDLILINRILLRTIIAYEQFYKKNEKDITPLLTNFHDLREHLTRSQRLVEHNIEKLNTIYSFYSARSNDKMNYSIYILTILSAIFLPLNLMVGFFGMNTGSLPFIDPGGTSRVLLLLGSTFLILFLFLIFRGKK
ncbi:MAG: Unknown protein [uncultured Sulfurovum sp.]|uniref:Magnesium and cobalt transport protein CorA n=1 Tax=uncultured Sulfurovum sp. TaxID=269237 RepID=A0A6S6T2Q0_9BACT|nr:MAG: Unknown protein [uncultured Sulfurovum sp.]